MDIITKVEFIRDQVKGHGLYRVLAEKSGVSYEWLCKFAVGAINNPTVGNVAKLEKFFNQQNL
jgi:hypothetical protein